MLSDFYYSVDVIEQVEAVDSWGNTTKSFNPIVVDRVVQGFIQPISGSQGIGNSKLTESSTHRLYTDDTTITIDSRVRKTGTTEQYEVRFSEQQDGISGIGDHQEILLEVIDV